MHVRACMLVGAPDMSRCRRDSSTAKSGVWPAGDPLTHGWDMTWSRVTRRSVVQHGTAQHSNAVQQPVEEGGDHLNTRSQTSGRSAGTLADCRG
jgi:hypothetical protein